MARRWRQAHAIVVARRLLRLLRSSTRLSTNIPADIGSIGSLLDDTLEGVPSILSSRRRALVGKLSVDATSQLVNSLLDKAALSDAGAEEDGVDGEQDPRALLEEERRADDAEPEEDLEQGN
jgi:hypothetical protein